MIEAGDLGCAQAGVGPALASGSIGVVDRGQSDRTRGEGHPKGHIRVGWCLQGAAGVACCAVQATVDHEELAVWKDDELAHGPAFEHVIILLIGGCRAVSGFWGERLAIPGRWVFPCIHVGGCVVAPGRLGDVEAAAEESGGVVVVSGGQGQHGDSAGRSVNTNHAAWHTRQRGSDVGVVTPEDCENIK